MIQGAEAPAADKSWSVGAGAFALGGTMGSEYTAYESEVAENGDLVIARVYHRRGGMAWTHLPGKPLTDPRCHCKEQARVRPLQKGFKSAPVGPGVPD